MGTCIFCTKIQEHKKLVSTEHFFVVFDSDPIQIGHLLIISKKHYMNLRELPREALVERMNLEQKLIALLEDEFGVLGVTVIQNNGKVMDEGTHFHVHLVPRYANDGFWENQTVEQLKLDGQKIAERVRQLIH
ncbi:HIT family protein [Enterococcus sp. LJL98]